MTSSTDRWARFLSRFSSRALRREIDEELDLHLEMRARDFESAGMDPAAARREAERRFGDAARIRREAFEAENTRVRREERALYIDAFRQDLFYGLRQIVRRPGFTAVVVLILALGIGANTAIFSVFRTIYLRPLPYASPHELALVWRSDARTARAPISMPNFLDWRESNRTFEGLAAMTSARFVLTGAGEEPEQLLTGRTTHGLFEILRVQPALGRTFSPDEEVLGNDRVVMLSNTLWRRRYDADPDIVGRTVTVNGEPRAVVGVLPEGFEHPLPWFYGVEFEMWVPLPPAAYTSRSSNSYLAVGRFKPGIGRDAAQEDMNAIAAWLSDAYPEANEGDGINVATLHDELLGGAGRSLLFLLAATGLVLLIACGNVASLLMARAAARRTEIAVRTALGAGRQRLLRQLITENLPLSLLGGVAGFLAAAWGVSLLRSVIPAGAPRVDQLGVDASVLAFTLVVALATGLIFSLAPAASTWRVDLTDALKEGSRGAVATPGASLRRLPSIFRLFTNRNALVAVQLALALVLANGAALMLNSYARLRATEQNFDTENVLVMSLTLRGPRFEDHANVRAHYDEVVRRVEALPGVSRVGGVSKLPLRGGTNGSVVVEGREDETGGRDGPLVEISVVTSGYHEAMGIRLVAGRGFEPADTNRAHPGVIINQTMAERLWPGESPLGKRILFETNTSAPGGVAPEPIWSTVVGVVVDVRQWGIETPAIPEVYRTYNPAPPSGMHSFSRVRWLVIRTEVEPTSLIPTVRREVLAIAPDQPVGGGYTMAQLVEGRMIGRRFNTLLLSLFAGIALALVAAGVYGVMSYFVAQRTQEIGVRMALGAERGNVLRLVILRTLKLTALGIVLGLAGIYATTRTMASMVYGIGAMDPPTIVAGVLFLILVAVMSAIIPAVRATRVDPLAALRTS